MNQQSWALEPGQIAACLFSDQVETDDKARVSAKLLAQAPASSLHLSSPCNPSLPAEEPIYADHNLNSSVAPKTASVRPKPDGLLRGQPPFPEILHSSELSDFVQPRSVIFIKRFCPNADEWIGKNPPWDSIEGFKHDKQIVRSISNTNDAAERLCAVAKRYRVRHIFVVVLKRQNKFVRTLRQRCV